MLKAVFFDAAGTLFDAREPVGHTYARIARKHGLAAGDALVSAGFGRAFSSLPGLAFGPGHDGDELRRRERQWWYRLVRKSFEQVGEFEDFDGFFAELFGYFGDHSSWVALPEAHFVLQRLKDTGLKLGVISNFDHRLYGILEGLKLRPFFDTVTISSEAGFAKPSREIFTAALSATRVDCAQALHIGDSQALDVLGEAAGLRAILMDVGMAVRRAIDGSGARVSSLAEVIEVVRFTYTGKDV